jgi:hypothetical protein
MAQIIHGANIGYVMKKKPVAEPIPAPVVETPVADVENQPVADTVVEKPVEETGGNEGGTGAELADHSINWKAKREKKKSLQDRPAE